MWPCLNSYLPYLWEGLALSILNGMKETRIWPLCLVQKQLRQQSHPTFIQGKFDWNRKRQGALQSEFKLGEDKVELARSERCHLNLERDKNVGEETRRMVWTLYVASQFFVVKASGKMYEYSFISPT